MDRTKLIGIIVVIIAILAVGSYLFVSANTTNTKIQITSNSTLENGEFIEFDLKDEYRNILPGESVDIKLLDDSGSATRFTAVTDDSGHGAVELLGLENGNYTVHCTYNGTLFHSKAKSVTSLNIDDGYSF